MPDEIHDTRVILEDGRYPAIETFRHYVRNDHEIFTDAEWANACQIRETVANSKVFSEGKYVLYAGAGCDMVKPLAFTDAQLFVFVDRVYANPDPNYPEFHSPISDILAIGGKMLGEPKFDGEMGKGGKCTITFVWDGKTRRVVMYAEDATIFVPTEVSEKLGCAMFMAVGFSGETKPETPTQFVNSVSIEGFVLGDLGFDDPLKHGLLEVVADPNEGLDPYVDGFRGFALYKKFY